MLNAKNAIGKKVTLNIEEPKKGVTKAEIDAAMQTVVENNVQMSSKILHRKVMKSLHRSVSSFLHSLVRSFLHPCQVAARQLSGKHIRVL